MADYDVVCAIDFGTTFSGFAFSQRVDPEKVCVKNDWGNILGIMGATKTPTTLLVLPNEKVFKIGYDALEEYIGTDKDAKICKYFEKFKMKLYEKDAGKLTADTKIEDQYGQPELALKVFAEVLNEMKTLFLDLYGQQIMGKPDDSKVRWVVTVPAIWSDGAKQFMREAAAKGGLVEKADSKKLFIALEPECASVMCQTLPVESYSSTSRSPKMSVGTQYLVLDAGGGTLDITVHEVLSDRKLKEIYVVSGTAAGGAQIDAAFIELIDKIFEKPFMQIFKKKDPPDFFDFMTKFEPLKRGFFPNSKALNFPIPLAMAEIYKGEFGQQLKDSISEEYCKKGVAVRGGSLAIPLDVGIGIFTPTVSTIVSYVKELLTKKELKNVTAILMVGGLSSSKILQEEVQKEFGKKYNIIIPDDPSSMVVKGASIFGHKLNAIQGRIVRKTYGTDGMKEYDPKVHKGAATEKKNGKTYALNVFTPFIWRGTSIDNDQCYEETYVPFKKDQQTMTIRFFATSSENPMYTTDDGMEKLGQMTVDLPGKGLQREVKVTMKFGGTNIVVEGRDMRSNKPVQTTLDFLSS